MQTYLTFFFIHVDKIVCDIFHKYDNNCNNTVYIIIEYAFAGDELHRKQISIL